MGDTFSSQLQSRHVRFDDDIHMVAEAISEDRDLRKLGVQLGLRTRVISRAIAKNWENGPKTTNGNNWMLRKWANTITRSEKLLPALKSALYKVGLTEIAETYLPTAEVLDRAGFTETSLSSGIAGQKEDVLHLGASSHESESAGPKRSILRSRSNSTPEIEPAGLRKNDPNAQSVPNLNTKSDAHSTAMPDGVRNLRDRLKTRYRKKFSQVKTSSVEPDSLKWLQNIFVSLLLILKSSLSKDETTNKEMSIEDVYGLIEKESEKGFITRVALIGEVGVGKSTLFSKIALDWANDKCLPDIDLLFCEQFQDMEETKSFGNLVRNIFPDDITQSEGEQIETYIQANQRKAAILIDDIDETKMNFLAKNPSNTVVSIVRGDKFQDTPVLIGTRPYVVDLIKNNDILHQLYTLIEVKGFTKEGTRQYIKQFFEEDRDSATSLIQFLEWNAMASELMAPYPIFCAILCNIWKTEIKREAIEQLSTISHILKQVYFSLLERYSWKRNSGSGYTHFMKKADDAMKIVADVAFEGLIEKQVTFDCGQESTESRKKAADTLYEIGILSKEKKVESRKIRQEGKHYKEVFRFPHKLLQEYIASFHLASLYERNSSQFNKILEDTLLVDLEKYRYLLFFTASQGDKVGKSIMEALCQQVNDVSFIMEVAFECNDEAAFNSVKELLIHEKSVGSDFSTKHIFAAYVYALETYGKQVKREVKHRPTEETSESTKLHSDGPSNYARALCHLPNLRSLELADNYFQNEIFFSTMATEAKNSQIEKLRHVDADLGPDASRHYARGLCSMPKLQSLELHKVKMTDEFYSTMLDEGGRSKIQTLRMEWCEVNKHILCAILSLPNLKSLSLVGRLCFLDDMAERKKKNEKMITSVCELSIDGRCMAKLWKLGLHTSCPRVKKLALYFYGEDFDSSLTVPAACSPFRDLAELHINRQKTLDPEEFCDAVKRSCPKLRKLTLTRIELNNDKATEIIQTMKTHPHLTIIELDTCWTDDSLDPVITEVKSEGKLTVSVTHGSI